MLSMRKTPPLSENPRTYPVSDDSKRHYLAILKLCDYTQLRCLYVSEKHSIIDLKRTPLNHMKFIAFKCWNA